jgi:hypothetical protein
LYLGAAFAPALIFFAVTGAWQLFDLHKNSRNGERKAIRVLAELSAIHKNSHQLGTPAASPTPLRYFSLAASLGLVVTTALGLVMAFRFTARPAGVIGCLAIGIFLPLALLWAFH